MENREKLEWSAPEYEEKERSRDWFWALGVIIVTAALTSIIFQNYFFAALIVLGGALLWIFAKRPPEIITYELNNQGLKIKTRLYSYENIKSFWVQNEEKEGKILKPLLFLHTERFFMPIISIPIEKAHAFSLREIFLAKNVPEEEMREHLSEKIMESLGF
ncbi:hypothetical protein A2933_01090 [Candidatus Nomurabacteria bacterium RIFCSPLOWO2_01_FULL_46_18]|uniref:DUF5673 domain-containing protein n=1 Tax=Candidatus Nomurabacteria bacterium RIFCSPLOWO2_01_FULL_46_18 TaxID=1801783 RepID=A0A1F6XEE3_9BACT|nr:MAG: hypothetical protein A2933_01090 [Candidatus Nomurabacteria bacterium RIFCSPLOWO2_01_FULL_46_18]